mgnify:CR=1 FL=1
MKSLALGLIMVTPVLTVLNDVQGQEIDFGAIRSKIKNQEEVLAEDFLLAKHVVRTETDAVTVFVHTPTESEIDSVVLTAPDVDRGDFNEQFREQIRALSRQLIVYVSSNDRALLMCRLINRGLRVGESTLSPDMLDEAEMIAQLVEPGSDLVTLIDVTPINRTRNFHNFSLETPEFYDDLFQRLTSDEAPRNRRSYRVQTPEGNVYWVLTRGR